MTTPSAAPIVLPISLFSSWECLQSDTYSCKPWTSVGRDKELFVTPLQFLWCCYTPAMLRQQVWWSECLIRFKCILILHSTYYWQTPPSLPSITQPWTGAYYWRQINNVIDQARSSMQEITQAAVEVKQSGFGCFLGTERRLL